MENRTAETVDVGTVIKAMAQQSTSLQKLSRGVQQELKQSNQLSIYGLGEVSALTLAACVSEIKKAFPELPNGWYDVLEKMLDGEGFTNERLIDATKALIRTCPYPKPTIANLIGFDKRVKVYTYPELLEHKKDSSAIERREYLESFGRINFFGMLRFAKNDDIKLYNLPTWEENKKQKEMQHDATN
jgi:hypothetical protein